MRSPETEALLTNVREAVTEARRAGITVEACLWDAAVAAVDQGAHGWPSTEARRLAESIRRGMEPPEIAVKNPPTDVTLTIPEMHVGSLHRREVRAAIRASRVLGADVYDSEQRGLLSSVITIRAVGSLEALAPLTRFLEETR